MDKLSWFLDKSIYDIQVHILFSQQVALPENQVGAAGQHGQTMRAWMPWIDLAKIQDILSMSYVDYLDHKTCIYKDGWHCDRA